MFGTSGTTFGGVGTGGFGGGMGLSGIGGMTATSTTSNPNKDFEVVSPPDDSISSLAFSPATTAPNVFLVAGSWDNNVSIGFCWYCNDAVGRLEMTGGRVRAIE